MEEKKTERITDRLICESFGISQRPTNTYKTFDTQTKRLTSIFCEMQIKFFVWIVVYWYTRYNGTRVPFVFYYYNVQVSRVIWFLQLLYSCKCYKQYWQMFKFLDWTFSLLFVNNKCVYINIIQESTVDSHLIWLWNASKPKSFYFFILMKLMFCVCFQSCALCAWMYFEQRSVLLGFFIWLEL